MSKVFNMVLGPSTADSIMADLVQKISRLQDSYTKFSNIAESKREQADELLLEAADTEKEAEKCAKFKAKLEAFFE